MSQTAVTMSSPDVRPTRFHWVVFAVACSASWMLYLHRYTFALIKPILAREWGLNEEQLGWIDSAESSCYLLFQVPLGALVDGVGVRLVLTLLMVCWSAGMGVCAAATSVPLMAFGRALFGAGQSAVYAALNRVSRNWFPASVRSSMQGLVAVFSGRIGGLSSYVVVGSLMMGVLNWGWQPTLAALAASGLLLAIGFAALFRNSPWQHPRVNTAEARMIDGVLPGEAVPAAPPRMTRREVLRGASRRSLLNLFALNVQSILSTLADNIYSSWIPLFLATVHGFKLEKGGLYSALPLLGGAIGGVVGGWLNDGLIARTGNRRWSRTSVALAGKGMAAVLLLAAIVFTYDSPRAFCFMLFAVKFFSDWSLTTSWSTVTDIGGRTTATVFAFNNTVASIASVIAPLLFGYVAAHYDWKAVFTITWIVYGLCALSWLAIDCTIPVLREKPE
ncbi:MAG: MFS transporter [Planctomycetaceae bacterium]|nr:MFS transporter [Planctomycetaceae bacterium]